jgi:hypothetical protein
MIERLCQNFPFLPRANYRAERVDSFLSIVQWFLFGMSWTSKSFKLLTFWLLDLASRLRGWLKQKDIFLLKKQIVTLWPAAPIKLAPLSTSHPIISRSCLLISSCYFHSCCATTALNSMATKSTSNLLPANSSIDDDTRGDSGAESTVMTTSSSLTRGASMMAKGEIPEVTYFFKKISVSEEELQAYHCRGWLTGNVLSSIPEVDVPTIHDSSILCFESHLLAGLGLPPSKFLAAIMNYLGC